MPIATRREIAQTGRCRFPEELRSRFPPGITQLLTLPGLGPKRVRELEGFGEKSEKRILEAVEARLRARGAAR